MKKFLYLVAICVSLSSCATSMLWEEETRGQYKPMTLQGFFLDREKGRVVLIAESPQKDLWHYSLTPVGDSSFQNTFPKVLDLAKKTQSEIAIDLFRFDESRTVKKFWIQIAFVMNNLSNEDLSFLKPLNKFKNDNVTEFQWRFGVNGYNSSLRVDATTYPSSQEVMEKYQDEVTHLKPLQIEVSQKPTILDKTGGIFMKVVKTPFTASKDLYFGIRILLSDLFSH